VPPVRLVLFGTGLALLMAAWVWSNPLAAGPDEGAHYVRALGVGSGDWVGDRFVPSEAERRAFAAAAEGLSGGADGTAVTGKGFLWQGRTTREFSVPQDLSDVRFLCTWREPSPSDCDRAAPASSSALTYTGTYQPYVYLAPGLAMRFADTSATALRIGRVVFAVMSLALLFAAAALLLDPAARGLSLIGLWGAITPMVVFTGTVVSASGPEICAGICFSAAMWRLVRAPGTRGAWPALAVSGAILGSARTLGPLFVLLLALIPVAFAGWGAARATVGLHRRQAAATALVLVGAAAAGLFWELHYQPHPSSSLGSLWAEVDTSIADLPDVLKQSVGYFGALDSPLPRPAYYGWLLLLAVVTGSALRFAGPTERRLLLGVLLGAALVAVVASVFQRQTGFGLQGRHLLPLLVAIPLTCGELLRRHRYEIPHRLRDGLVIGVPLLAALIQAIAWYANARYAAVGVRGPWNFIGDAGWSPAGGWYLWLGIAAAGAALYASPAVVELRQRRVSSPGE
jgi:Predicted membrane protein (DUF2142)